MNRLDVQARRLQGAMAVVMGLIMVPLALAAIFTGLGNGFNPVPVGIGVLMLATFGAVVWLQRRAHGRSVRWFSDEGLQRNDGQWMAWKDLERVVHQIRPDPAKPGDKALWRTEIWFRDGRSAWLLPLRVANRGEVDAFVARLPCEHAEKEV